MSVPEVVIELAALHGLAVKDPVVLHDSYNLRIHLRPYPVVARVATVTSLGRPRPGEALARELSVASFLAERGAAVVPPTDLMPPGPFSHAGLDVSFWQFVEHDPARVFQPGEVAAALAELHEALRDYPGELPYLGPALEETAHLIETVDVPDRFRAAFADVGDRLRGRPAQALHGDAHPGNLLATAEGLLWTDFEETCSGPVDWDLACLARTSRLDGAEAVRLYGRRPDPAFSEARELQAIAWMLTKARAFPEFEESARAYLGKWLDEHPA
ncbi:phosphotransferase family protein [Nonomuraea sp. NPDC059194]|uniref:phosphotransferase family protein n=1 Tax=Nonomuraea sp. NPDC059194 TaxID=3346764 RepID=UPI003699F9F9